MSSLSLQSKTSTTEEESSYRKIKTAKKINRVVSFYNESPQRNNLYRRHLTPLKPVMATAVEYKQTPSTVAVSPPSRSNAATVVHLEKARLRHNGSNGQQMLHAAQRASTVSSEDGPPSVVRLPRARMINFAGTAHQRSHFTNAMMVTPDGHFVFDGVAHASFKRLYEGGHIQWHVGAGPSTL